MVSLAKFFKMAARSGAKSELTRAGSTQLTLKWQKMTKSSVKINNQFFLIGLSRDDLGKFFL